MREFVLEILKLIGTLPRLAKTLIIVLIIVLVGGYFYVKAMWAHEDKQLEIINKYSTEKRSLEVALENCQTKLGE
jgi:Tfp pilus assembly protein PilO